MPVHTWENTRWLTSTSMQNTVNSWRRPAFMWVGRFAPWRRPEDKICRTVASTTSLNTGPRPWRHALLLLEVSGKAEADDFRQGAPKTVWLVLLIIPASLSYCFKELRDIREVERKWARWYDEKEDDLRRMTCTSNRSEDLQVEAISRSNLAWEVCSLIYRTALTKDSFTVSRWWLIGLETYPWGCLGNAGSDERLVHHGSCHFVYLLFFWSSLCLRV